MTGRKWPLAALGATALLLSGCSTSEMADMGFADMDTARQAYKDEDWDTARRHYERLAAAGFPRAKLELGKMHLYGKGMEKDPQKALALFEEAEGNGESGDRRAPTYIRRAQTYVGADAIRGEAEEVSPEEGFAMLVENAEGGSDRALFEVGYAYEKGRGTQVSGYKAAEYYRKAGETGYGRADYHLARLYEKGELVPQNMVLAVRHYRSAAKNDYPRAYLNLGRLYEKGVGVPQNASRARYYYHEAQSNDISADDDIERLRNKIASGRLAS